MKVWDDSSPYDFNWSPQKFRRLAAEHDERARRARADGDIDDASREARKAIDCRQTARGKEWLDDPSPPATPAPEPAAAPPLLSAAECRSDLGRAFLDWIAYQKTPQRLDTPAAYAWEAFKAGFAVSGAGNVWPITASDEPAAAPAVGEADDRDTAYEAWKLNGRLGALDHKGGFAAGWNAALTRPATVTAQMVGHAIDVWMREWNGQSGYYALSIIVRNMLTIALASQRETAALSARQEGGA